jgi:hypothetical protein
MTFRLTLLICLVTMATGIAQARNESMRCGSKLVGPGMSLEEVRKYCGQPPEASSEERPIRSGNRVLGSYQADIWQYRLGTSSHAVLEFHDGVLKSISFPGKR